MTDSSDWEKIASCNTRLYNLYMWPDGKGSEEVTPNIIVYKTM